MVTPALCLHQYKSFSLEQLLVGDEVIAIVDDDAAIRVPLSEYFKACGLATAGCETGTEIMRLLDQRNVALVLLDIGLPDIDGLSLLPRIVENHPDVSVIMFTGVTDLQVALQCIRQGADDYLSKPVQLDEIFHAATKALEKRRLIFENRKYQAELEEANFRIKLLHQLSIKMNTVYLGTVGLDEILRAILVGITANEGLGFNRAFLVMFNPEQTFLEGRMAIGTSNRKEAGRIWSELHDRKFDFFQILRNIENKEGDGDAAVNGIISNLKIPVTNNSNVVIRAALDRRSIKVSKDNGVVLQERRIWGGCNSYNGEDGCLKERRHEQKDAVFNLPLPDELIQLLNEDNFIVVPLYSPSRSFGVIIADNFVTRRPILASHVNALELLAGQASLVIEHTYLYLDLQKKISELEALNHELDENKNLLVEAERYSALGQMAAQLVHSIRNPVTSIGGVSRILSKKINDPDLRKYLDVVVKETGRLESTLGDLFDFVIQTDLKKEDTLLYPLIKKTLMLVQKNIDDSGVVVHLDLLEPSPLINVDLHQMRQVFLRLIHNALDAMHGGGIMTISAKIWGDKVRIAVQDSGAGISENYIAEAVNPFFTTKIYGTGLGLTMVQRIVEAHNGTFQLKKQETGGTEAMVVLSTEKQM